MIVSDISDTGIGADILHKFKDRKRKTRANASRILLVAEKKYSQIEKEALGIIFAVKNFVRLCMVELFFFTNGPLSVIKYLQF